jgi:hypothetical protein
MRDQNITIGVTVGILLAAFLAGVCYFLYRYGESIRIYRRRSRRRHSKGSRSSGGSGSSAESAAAAQAQA